MDRRRRLRRQRAHRHAHGQGRARASCHRRQFHACAAPGLSGWSPQAGSLEGSPQQQRRHLRRHRRRQLWRGQDRGHRMPRPRAVVIAQPATTSYGGIQAVADVPFWEPGKVDAPSCKLFVFSGVHAFSGNLVDLEGEAAWLYLKVPPIDKRNVGTKAIPESWLARSFSTSKTPTLGSERKRSMLGSARVTVVFAGIVKYSHLALP